MDARSRCFRSWRINGFTVIELLVVLAAIALLLSVAAPRYIQHLDHAREVALKQNLRQMREAIDKFYNDHSRYPAALTELVERKYLRSVPEDSMTQRSDTWVSIPPDASNADHSGVFDVRSGSVEKAHDGSRYATW